MIFVAIELNQVNKGITPKVHCRAKLSYDQAGYLTLQDGADCIIIMDTATDPGVSRH